MRRELARYASFTGWPPGAAAWPNKLAAAGFYYTGQSDEVACYSCGVTCSNWQPGMSPLQEHRRLQPTCCFLNNTADNVPVEEGIHAHGQLRLICGDFHAHFDNSGHAQSNPHTTEVACGPPISSTLAATVAPEDIHAIPSLPVLQTHEPCPISSRQHQQASLTHQLKPSNTASSASHTTGILGIHTDKQLHPEFALTSKRLASYSSNWPHSGPNFTKDLAEAGFYFSGLGDRVTCFYCGTVLERWECGDSPWVEHARWSPHCVYLNTHQGLEFVSLVQDLVSGGNQVNYEQVREILDDAPLTHAPLPRPSSAGEKDDHEVQEAQEEHEQLLQQAMCKICLDREVTIVFLPCGHLVCCPECAPALKHCPVCRVEIRGSVRAYMS